jgi:hypothetical protein
MNTSATLSSTRPIADRELHLLDIENLLGGSQFSAQDVAQFRDFYLAANDVAEDAHIVIATSSAEGLVEAGLGWQHARTIFRNGHDGADLALLEVIDTEHVTERFTKIVIASGDGIFARAAEQMFDQGIDVSVFAPALAVSGQFSHASQLVHLFSSADFRLAA